MIHGVSALCFDLTVPYKPGQLPYLGYRDWVKRCKKAHDMAGRPYPLTIRVFDREKQQLLEQTFKNVWDRASKVSIVAVEDWNAPIYVCVTCGDGDASLEFQQDEVKVPEKAIQMRLVDFFGDDCP